MAVSPSATQPQQFGRFISIMAEEANHSKLLYGLWSGYAIGGAFGALALLANLAGLIPWHWSFYALIGVKLITNTVALVCLKTRRAVLPAQAFNTTADLVLMTAAIYFTGGPLSPLFPIYVIEIAVVALLSNLGVTVLVAIVALGLYGTMSILVYLGVLPTMPPPVSWAGGLTLNYVVTDLIYALFVLATPTFFTAAILRLLRRTERALQTEEARVKIQQSQRLEALGTLAGGVAHDMNNIMGGIMAIASTMKSEINSKNHWVNDVDEILSGCRRGRDLTKNLLGFARKGTYTKVPISLNDIAQQIKQLLERTIDRTVTVDAKLDPDLLPVEGDASQLQHALMNICLNAADAMPSGGLLTIATSNVVLADSDLKGHPDLQPGTYVKLEVIDTGAGMTRQTIDQAFEPFFTTKPPGKGTGLGLPMVYGTVTSHGGMITINSELGRGTTVTCCFRSLPAEARSSARERSPEKESRKARANTILVVDDEELILSASRRLLQRLGFEVLLAESGEQAVSLFRESRDEIVLILLDLVMPVMDGAETFRRLKAIDPEVRVLVASGFSREGKAEELLSNGALGFVQKPFEIEEIRSLIESVMRRDSVSRMKL